VTHGNNNVLGINWSENLPDKPSVSVGYQMGNSAYSVYGTNDQGNNDFHSLNLHSAYRVADFANPVFAAPLTGERKDTLRKLQTAE